jgi:hypothetical protein
VKTKSPFPNTAQISVNPRARIPTALAITGITLMLESQCQDHRSGWLRLPWTINTL